jgi:hypothetical protein
MAGRFRTRLNVRKVKAGMSNEAFKEVKKRIEEVKEEVEKLCKKAEIQYDVECPTISPGAGCNDGKC